MRVLWLPTVLRAAGLTVHEVPGWRTRGADSYGPVRGITCHHTGGARTSTDAGEINVLVHGRPGLSGPISQTYLSRTGDWHVVASGHCNHNKVGWGGPNQGFGNDSLLGVEAQHAEGEPWTDEQYDSYVCGVAALVAHQAPGWDVTVGRVAGHREHQPGAKTDPNFDMDTFRARVRTQIEDGDDDMATITQSDFNARMDAWWNARMSPAAKDNAARTALRGAPWHQEIGRTGRSAHDVLFGTLAALDTAVDAVLANVVADDGDLQKIRAEIQTRVAQLPKAVLAELGAGGQTPAETAAVLRVVLGDQAAPVGRILAKASTS